MAKRDYMNEIGQNVGANIRAAPGRTVAPIKAIAGALTPLYEGLKSGLAGEAENPAPQIAAPSSPFTAPGSTLAPPVGLPERVGPTGTNMVTQGRQPVSAVAPTPAIADPSETQAPAIGGEADEFAAQGNGGTSGVKAGTLAAPARQTVAEPAQGMSQEMTSTDAAVMRERFRAQNDMGPSAFRAAQMHPDSVAGRALSARWEAAREKALQGSMSPKQWAEYQQKKQKDAIESGNVFKQSPEYLLGEQKNKGMVDAASAAAGPKAAEIQIELAKLKQHTDLTAAQMAQAERLAIQGIKADDARTQVIQQGETSRSTANNATQKEIAQGKVLSPEDRFHEALQGVAKTDSFINADEATQDRLTNALRKQYGLAPMGGQPAAGQPAATAAQAAPVKKYANGEKTLINGVTYVYDAQSGKLKKQ